MKQQKWPTHTHTRELMLTNKDLVGNFHQVPKESWFHRTAGMVGTPPELLVCGIEAFGESLTKIAGKKQG